MHISDTVALQILQKNDKIDTEKIAALKEQHLQEKKPIAELASRVKGMLVVEFNAGQMVNDVRLAVNGKTKVEYYGRMGGIVPSPNEVESALYQKLTGE